MILTSERATGFEPATSSLGSWHSTPELRPRGYSVITYTVRLAVYARGNIGGNIQPSQPVPKLSSELFNAVLYPVGSVTDLPQVSVDPAHHRLCPNRIW